MCLGWKTVYSEDHETLEFPFHLSGGVETVGRASPTVKDLASTQASLRSETTQYFPLAKISRKGYDIKVEMPTNAGI